MRIYNLVMVLGAVHNLKILRDRRRELRRKSTPTEKILWVYLRNNKLGVKFKRQYSVGGYILDFYCPQVKLAIEIDGGIHDSSEAQEYDKVRDSYFAGQDFKILRFKSIEVRDNTHNVLQKIKAHIQET
jgi:very-short-patch-repair endonuclease